MYNNYKNGKMIHHSSLNVKYEYYTCIIGLIIYIKIVVYLNSN